MQRTQLGGAPDLLKVNEGGEFKYGTMGESKETYQLATYGRIMALTRQTLINDDLDAFTRIPAAFGASAADLESDMVYALLTGAVTNALNMPSISAEEAVRLTPFVRLAEDLGSFAGQLTESTLRGITIEYAGEVAEMNTKALTSALLCGLLRPILTEVNMVNAPVVAREAASLVTAIRRPVRSR